jgi:HAD superfamily hydrolase (TIGR01509 family)
MLTKDLFIFDMDGVLLESEPFWRKAQIESLARLGVSATVEDCICHTMGKRLDDIAHTWINMFALNITAEELAQSILERVVFCIGSEGTANNGVDKLIAFLRSKNCRIALATSSSKPIISAVIDKLGLNDVFELTLSADEVANGKPAPDVYLEVCRRLDISPEKAIALEDSLTGVRSAVAAGITTIAVPEHNKKEFAIADYIVNEIENVIDLTEEYFK